MMDLRTNVIHTAATVEELEQRIPPQRRGPSFALGDTIDVGSNPVYRRMLGWVLAHIEEGHPQLLVFQPNNEHKAFNFQPQHLKKGDEVEWKDFRWEVRRVDSYCLVLKPLGRSKEAQKKFLKSQRSARRKNKRK